MHKKLTLVAGAAVAAMAPVVASAPDNQVLTPDGVCTVEDAVARLRDTGLSGIELVDAATDLVRAKFAKYSAWRLWESPGRAFEKSRGYSGQYNIVLAQVLRRLDVPVSVVHAARVRYGDRPWWYSGHTWLQVDIDGRVLDVCAGDRGNRAGRVLFVPVSEVRPVNPWTTRVVALAMVPFIAQAVWAHLIADSPIPRWLYRDFGERP